jgi:hypothetical protein
MSEIRTCRLLIPSSSSRNRIDRKSTPGQPSRRRTGAAERCWFA